MKIRIVDFISCQWLFLFFLCFFFSTRTPSVSIAEVRMLKITWKFSSLQSSNEGKYAVKMMSFRPLAQKRLVYLPLGFPKKNCHRFFFQRNKQKKKYPAFPKELFRSISQTKKKQTIVPQAGCKWRQLIKKLHEINYYEL